MRSRRLCRLEREEKREREKSACLFLLQTGKVAGVGGLGTRVYFNLSERWAVYHPPKEREPLPNLVRSAPTCNSARVKIKKERRQRSTNTVSLSLSFLRGVDRQKKRRRVAVSSLFLLFIRSII